MSTFWCSATHRHGFAGFAGRGDNVAGEAFVEVTLYKRGFGEWQVGGVFQLGSVERAEERQEPEALQSGLRAETAALAGGHPHPAPEW